MKLFYSPGACSIGIHVLLEEIGAPYELEAVNLRMPPPERSVTPFNPKARVPTLVRDDGSVLTEYGAIALWLARSFPAANLIPTDTEGEVRALEALDYCVGTVHMQGFSRLFSAARLKTPEETQGQTALGHEIVERSFGRLDAMLGRKDWLVGDYSAADSALFYVCLWAANFSVALPGNVAAHFARMRARPAVLATFRQEGLA